MGSKSYAAVRLVRNAWRIDESMTDESSEKDPRPLHLVTKTNGRREDHFERTMQCFSPIGPAILTLCSPYSHSYERRTLPPEEFGGRQFCPQGLRILGVSPNPCQGELLQQGGKFLDKEQPWACQTRGANRKWFGFLAPRVPPSLLGNPRVQSLDLPLFRH